MAGLARGGPGRFRLAGSRRHLSGALAALTAIPLAVQLVGVPPAGAAPACPVAAADTAAAAVSARSCGSAVEDLSQRDETTDVFANPDGTWTASMSAEPVRVRRADGSWTPVDLTLTRRADGSVASVASPVPVTLSGGGSRALVALSAASGSLALHWPGPLPVPALSGARATYGEVLPGVDLVLTATTRGVNEVLVVKSRQAAANPALAELRFTTQLQGLTLVDRGSGMAALDAAGEPAAVIGAPMMWDSSTGAPSGQSSGPAGDESVDSDVSGAGVHAKRAVMPMRRSGKDLVVSPLTSILTAADTTFPVFVDPDLTKSLWAWTMVNSYYHTQEYWDYDRADHAKVGFTNEDKAGNPIPGMIYRSLFQFGTNAIRGKHILDADFVSRLIHSASCTASTTEVRRSTQQLGIGTTWDSNRGTWGSSLAYVSDQNCHDAANVVSHWSGQGITNVGIAAAASTSNYVTFGVKAVHEDSMAGWKKFDQAATKFVVRYNSYPATPDTLKIGGKGCGTGPNAPYVSTLGGRNLGLEARVSDADTADHLTGSFTWTTSTGTATGSESNVANGQIAHATASGASFTSGTRYSFTVKASDGTDWSRTSGGPCEFIPDASPPNKRPLVTSVDGRYPPEQESPDWHDGVGKPGQFSFAPNGVSDNGVNDVVGYLYGMTDPPMSSAVPASMGGTATASVTPTTFGTNDLYVRSVDRAGNLGPITDYRFSVGSGAPPIGAWHLDEGSGTTAADNGTGGQPLTLNGTAWTSGRVVGTKALTFNGSSSYATTNAPVLTTNNSYTVAAWVRLTNSAPAATVLAQQGSHASAAVLAHLPAGKWAFRVPASDTVNPPTVQATSAQNAEGSMWTHLAGVYDASAGQIRLYVNGTLAGSAAATVPWQATGPLSLGRQWLNDAYTQYFPGDIADVQVWDRVVAADELESMVAPVLVGQWALDEEAGTTAADGTGRHDLTLAAGASWVSPGHNDAVTADPGALAPDGTAAGHADAGGPVVKTEQSFTATAWVKLAATGSTTQIAVSQSGTNVHAFELGYGGASHNWVFRTVPTDVTSAAGSTIGSAANTAVAGEWTYLAGVWNAVNKSMSLYVNGILVSRAVTTTPFASSGPLTIGRVWADRAYVDPLEGQVDEVRLYAGALTDSQIMQVRNR